MLNYTLTDAEVKFNIEQGHQHLFNVMNLFHLKLNYR